MAQLKGVSIEEALGDLVVPRSFHVPMCLQVASRTTQNAVRLFGKASPNLQAECYAHAEGETRFAVVGGLHCEGVGEFLHWENSAVAERPQGMSEGFAPVRAGSRGQRNYLLEFVFCATQDKRKGELPAPPPAQAFVPPEPEQKQSRNHIAINIQR